MAHGKITKINVDVRRKIEDLDFDEIELLDKIYVISSVISFLLLCLSIIYRWRTFSNLVPRTFSLA